MTANLLLRKGDFLPTINTRKRDDGIWRNIPKREFPEDNHETVLMVDIWKIVED
jgi:hypothetical protein